MKASGIAAKVMYTGKPQTGQKARVFTLPLSPTMFHEVAALAWVLEEGLGHNLLADAAAGATAGVGWILRLGFLL